MRANKSSMPCRLCPINSILAWQCFPLKIAILYVVKNLTRAMVHRPTEYNLPVISQVVRPANYKNASIYFRESPCVPLSLADRFSPALTARAVGATGKLTYTGQANWAWTKSTPLRFDQPLLWCQPDDQCKQGAPCKLRKSKFKNVIKSNISKNFVVHLSNVDQKMSVSGRMMQNCSGTS